MKKKKITSKLQFQKTTVVSFNSMLNIKGGTLQNTDTRVVSINGNRCLTEVCTPTVGGCVSPTTASDNTCPPPTRGDHTLFCGVSTIRGCLDTRKC